MECDLNGFQRIRYVNGHVDIFYSYDVSFAGSIKKRAVRTWVYIFSLFLLLKSQKH